MSSNHFFDTSTSDAPCKVKRSPVHGNGVFATRHIGAGARIIEYLGERIDWPEALRRTAASDGPLNHTFYDYALICEARHTRAVTCAFGCLCGAARCRSTMPAPKQRKSRAKGTA